MVMSNFINEVFNGGSAPEFSVSALKEFIVLVQSLLNETRKWEEKLAEKYICELEIQSFSPIKHQISSSKRSMPSTLWFLPKLYELCKSCHRNSVQTFK